MSRARLVPGLLAALATLTASWPLTTLLADGSWVRPVLALLIVQCGVGALARYAGVGTWLTATLQTIAVLVGVMLLQLPDYLSPAEWSGLPVGVNDLFLDARETLTTFAAPAPVTPGVRFVLCLALPLVGVVVDVLAASLRMPAAAGLPLLALFLFSTSNTGQALNPMYFLVLGAAWLAILLHQGVGSVTSWSSTEAYARTPETGEDRLGIGAFSTMARWMGVVTLILAVAIPTVIPHLPPRFLADGLAQRDDAAGVASVGFTDTLDLANDLNNDNQTPILTYATTDVSPPPLKVLNLSAYSNGSWVREDPTRQVDGGDNENLPDPDGLSSRTPRRLERINVVGNGLDVPYIATPWPVASADMDGNDWYFDPSSAQPRVRQRTPEYSITYKSVGADARPNEDAEPGPVAADTRRIDPGSSAAVRAATRSALADGDAPTDFDKAIAIQDWLRDPSLFTYSLQLADTQTGPNGQPLDPISNFLATRRGYCTQFATAMVMMARSEGIPARMAVGFLPGTRTTSGNLQVRASDAHAWPELFFPGLGWTRFEPTPSERAGEVPSYAIPEVAPDSSRATRSTFEPSASTSTAAPSATASPTPTTTGNRDDSTWGFLTSRTFWLLIAALVVIFLTATLLPFAARWRREAQVRAATAPAEHVEAEWTSLESQLEDLGVDPPGERSPRQLEHHYRRRAPLESEGKEALHRAVQTLERARYAPPGAEPLTLERDADRILHDVRQQASWQNRMTARLFPRTGRRAVAEGVRKTAEAPLRRLRRLMRR